MKNQIFKFSFVLLLVWFFLAAGQAKADDSVTVRLQIKTHDTSLYDQNIVVSACADSATATTTTVNAKCAVEQSGLVSDWGWSGDLAFLNFVGVYANDYVNGIYWGWFENLNYSNLALNQYVLQPGDKILLTYGINPLKISTDNTSPYVNATSTITLEQFGLDASWSPVWLPAASSTLVIGAEEMENDSGVYIYTPLIAGEKIIYGKKDGYINSDNLTITAQDLATSTIRLQIKTNDASLYDQDIVVSACADSATATATSVNAKCAVEQSGLTSDWSWYGDDLGYLLNSIGSYANDYTNGIYWGWFSNLEYGQVALNKHLLVNGEKLLLTYNINPLKISTDNTSPYVNATSTITLEQFGLDASWSPVWLPAASSTLVIGAEEMENDSGTYIFTATTTAPVLIYGRKSGYIDSEEIIITAQAVASDDNESNNQPGGSVIIPATGGGGATVSVAAPTVDLGKAIDFLIAKQSADGSYGSVLQTDWAAIALASANPNGSAAQKTKSYLLADPDPLVGMNSVSDYARRAMALMSLNINPYTGTKTNYVKKIIDLYDGQQFGEASLYNDDIFALVVLAKAGYTADDEIIQNAVNFIISKQQADGSWIGTDLTAAAIQALTPLSSFDEAAPALLKARNFLSSAQGADGGFGNTYATAWAMQAIAALGEETSNWQKNNKTPENYLALSQGADGGLEKDNTYEANRIWATSYAIPAIQSKPWFNVMQNFSKLTEPNLAKVSVNEINIAADEIAILTLEIIDIATTTPEIIKEATSTEPQLINVQPDELISRPKAEVELKEKIVIPAPAAKPKAISQAVLGVKQKAAAPENNVNKTAPTVKVVADSIAPPDSSPPAKPSLLITTGRLIYRGLRYLLSLFGF